MRIALNHEILKLDSACGKASGQYGMFPQARGAGSRADPSCQGSNTFLEALMTTRSEVTGRSISQLVRLISHLVTTKDRGPSQLFILAIAHGGVLWRGLGADILTLPLLEKLQRSAK